MSNDRTVHAPGRVLDPVDLYVWDAGSAGRAVLGVTDHPLTALQQVLAVVGAMPAKGAYGVIRQARLDRLAGHPRYTYGCVLIHLRRSTAGTIEVADER